MISGVTAGAHTVRTQMIGYAPVSHDVTVADGAPADVDFTLAAQAIGLSALVVVGYGEQNAGNITGADYLQELQQILRIESNHHGITRVAGLNGVFRFANLGVGG